MNGRRNAVAAIVRVCGPGAPGLVGYDLVTGRGTWTGTTP